MIDETDCVVERHCAIGNQGGNEAAMEQYDRAAAFSLPYRLLEDQV